MQTNNVFNKDASFYIQFALFLTKTTSKLIVLNVFCMERQ